MNENNFDDKKEFENGEVMKPILLSNFNDNWGGQN